MAWGFAKAAHENILREKLRTSLDSWGRLISHKFYPLMPLHRGEHSLCQDIRQLIVCSNVLQKKE